MNDYDEVVMVVNDEVGKSSLQKECTINVANEKDFKKRKLKKKRKQEIKNLIDINQETKTKVMEEKSSDPTHVKVCVKDKKVKKKKKKKKLKETDDLEIMAKQSNIKNDLQANLIGEVTHDHNNRVVNLEHEKKLLNNCQLQANRMNNMECNIALNSDIIEIKSKRKFSASNINSSSEDSDKARKRHGFEDGLKRKRRKVNEHEHINNKSFTPTVNETDQERVYTDFKSTCLNYDQSERRKTKKHKKHKKQKKSKKDNTSSDNLEINAKHKKITKPCKTNPEQINAETIAKKSDCLVTGESPKGLGANNINQTILGGSDLADPLLTPAPFNIKSSGLHTPLSKSTPFTVTDKVVNVCSYFNDNIFSPANENGLRKGRLEKLKSDTNILEFSKIYKSGEYNKKKKNNSENIPAIATSSNKQHTQPNKKYSTEINSTDSSDETLSQSSAEGTTIVINTAAKEKGCIAESSDHISDFSNSTDCSEVDATVPGRNCRESESNVSTSNSNNQESRESQNSASDDDLENAVSNERELVTNLPDDLGTLTTEQICDILHASNGVTPEASAKMIDLFEGTNLVKTGKWNPDEDAQLKKNWNEYFEMYPYSDPVKFARPQVVYNRSESRAIKKKIKETYFWKFLGTGICRTLYGIYMRCLYTFCEADMQKGSWLKEEDEQLIRLYKIHGSNWRHISKLLDRPSKICGQRFNRYLAEEAKAGHAYVPWSEEEDERLLNSLKEMYGNVIPRVYYGIKWQNVAMAVKTRNNEHCRERWMRFLGLPSAACGSMKYKVQAADKVKVVKSLLKQNFKFQEDIKWDAVFSDFQRKLFPLHLQAIWIALKKKYVPNYKDKNDKECLEYVEKNALQLLEATAKKQLKDGKYAMAVDEVIDETGQLCS